MRKRLSSLAVAMLIAAVMVVGIPMTAFAGPGDYNKGRSCGCYKKQKPKKYNKCRVVKHYKKYNKCRVVKHYKKHKIVKHHKKCKIVKHYKKHKIVKHYKKYKIVKKHKIVKRYGGHGGGRR